MQEEPISFTLRTLVRLIKQRFDSCVSHVHPDVTTGLHGWILGYLYDRRGKEVFQRDLERTFSVQRATMSAILQRMEKNGLLVRLPVQRDARLKRLELTEKAAGIHRQIVREIENTEKQLLSGISPSEELQFRQTLEKIRSNAENAEKAEAAKKRGKPPAALSLPPMRKFPGK